MRRSPSWRRSDGPNPRPGACCQNGHGGRFARSPGGDGTIFQFDSGSLIAQAITNPTELQQANAVLNDDWHNSNIPQPPYNPIRVRTRSRKRQPA